MEGGSGNLKTSLLVLVHRGLLERHARASVEKLG